MILKLSLNTQIMCKMFINILKDTISKKHKKLIVFEDMIADVINNKKTKSSSNRIVY